MKRLIVLSFVLVVAKAQSQTARYLIKISPLALADPYYPSIQAGMEIKLSKKISWYNELGLKYHSSFISRSIDTTVLGSSGYKFKTECRYYFKTKSQYNFQGAYLAANLFYFNDHHSRRIDYSKPNNPDLVYIDDFGVKKQAFGLNLLFGYQRHMGKKCYFEAYGGIGLRIKNIVTVNKEYNPITDNIRHSVDPNIYDFGQGEEADGGQYFLPNLTLGFRIGFAFKHKG